MLFKGVGREAFAAAMVVVLVVAAGCNTNSPGGPDGGTLAQTLFVAHDGVLVSYDIATGNERPGTVTNISSPTDMQALEDGTVLANLTGGNNSVIVDGKTMVEDGRAGSSTGGTRPVHSYISPDRNGKRYFVALYDGAGSVAATSKAVFTNIKAGTANYLQRAGEVGLGVGHHKGAFSNTRDRVVFSNISDCDNVITAYDYSDITNIQTLKTWSARDYGWDGSTRAKTCDPTFVNGAPPAPHGCATSKVSGKIYCNLTQSGDIVATKIDDTPLPTFMIIPTNGSGSGYTKAHKDGRFVYSLQSNPREGQGGAICQVGQLVVIDASTDTVATTVSLLYKGPSCTTAVNGTDEETTEPDHIRVSNDGKTLYISTAGGFNVTSARVRQELVVDVTNPGAPVQRASIPVGTSTNHHGDSLSGDGKWLFVTNNLDGTVTQIDTSTNQVTKTLTVRSTPLTAATFGTNEGPSEQTGPIK
jgi:YVTN family beta-propeller protein